MSMDGDTERTTTHVKCRRGVSPEGSRNYQKQCEHIDQFLDALTSNGSQNVFTVSRFLRSAPPDRFVFTFDQDARHLTIPQWQEHCVTYQTAVDPCILPLCALATSAPSANLVPIRDVITKRHGALHCVPLTELSRLTFPQRRYLANVHADEDLRHHCANLLLTRGAEGVIHGDYRAPNILFRAEGHAPRLHIIDWEYCGIGPRVYDWSTLIAEYVTLYLCHYLETRGEPTQLHWSTIEQLLRQHYARLREVVTGNPETLAQEYLQWTGVILLSKGVSVIARSHDGELLAELFFQMGRRFVVEWEQLVPRYCAL